MMWYFSWILGTGLACTFAVLNAIWLEFHENDKDNAANVSKASN
nr:cytochrome bd-I oxidase subunit CydX [Legionella tunisiensis]